MAVSFGLSIRYGTRISSEYVTHAFSEGDDPTRKARRLWQVTRMWQVVQSASRTVIETLPRTTSSNSYNQIIGATRHVQRDNAATRHTILMLFLPFASFAFAQATVDGTGPIAVGCVGIIPETYYQSLASSNILQGTRSEPPVDKSVISVGSSTSSITQNILGDSTNACTTGLSTVLPSGRRAKFSNRSITLLSGGAWHQRLCTISLGRILRIFRQQKLLVSTARYSQWS
jgi:hypothetical protein